MAGDSISPVARVAGNVATRAKSAPLTGATGLALLPFLGAGHTHLRGEYRDVVHNGLYYLKNHIVMTPHGADLQEGTMYAQGIATIALCEAYAMTQDEELRVPAQHARSISSATRSIRQADGVTTRQQPGDTTVFGWQMMALKSRLARRTRCPLARHHARRTVSRQRPECRWRLLRLYGTQQ